MKLLFLKDYFLFRLYEKSWPIFKRYLLHFILVAHFSQKKLHYNKTQILRLKIYQPYKITLSK